MKTGETVAIKELDLEVTEEELTDIHNEISVLRKCSSPYVSKIFGSFVVERKLWIVMEYVGAGTIEDLLRPGFLEEMQVAVVLREILKGLDYLHSCDIIHRDVKPSNMLVCHECQIKIGDFGVCGEISDTVTRRHSFVGTPIYMSPEVIMQREGYSTPSDIWSLGICAFEMAEGRPPYWGIPPQRVIFMIPKNEPPNFDSKKNYSRDLRDFVKKCLRKDPSERPSAKELLNHPFIKNSEPNASLNCVIERWEEFKEKKRAEFETDESSSEDELSTKSSSSGKGRKPPTRIFWSWDETKVSVLPHDQVDKDLLREMIESDSFDINRIGKAKRVRGLGSDDDDDDEEEDDLSRDNSTTTSESDGESIEEEEEGSDEEEDINDNNEEEEEYDLGTVRKLSTPEDFKELNILKAMEVENEEKIEERSTSSSSSTKSTDESERARKIELRRKRFKRLQMLRERQMERTNSYEKKKKKMDPKKKYINLTLSPYRKKKKEGDDDHKEEEEERYISVRMEDNQNGGRKEEEFQMQSSSSSEEEPTSSKRTKKKKGKREEEDESSFASLMKVESSIPQDMLLDEIDDISTSSFHPNNRTKYNMMMNRFELIKSPISKDSFGVFQKIILPSIELTCDQYLKSLRDKEQQQQEEEEDAISKKRMVDKLKEEMINSFRRKESEIENFTIHFVENLYQMLDKEDMLRKQRIPSLQTYGVFSKRERVENVNTKYLESNLRKSLSSVFFERWKRKFLK